MFQNVDIFCVIIDNFGDIGVVYRFAKELKYYKPELNIRVFLDDLNVFKKLNPEINTEKDIQTINEITYINSLKLTKDFMENISSSEFVIETFGCEIPDIYFDYGNNKTKIVINLEYLSAENWIEEYHCKSAYSSKNWVKKYYFMMGLDEKSGGFTIDESFLNKKQKYIENKEEIINDFINLSLNHFKYRKEFKYFTLFSYEYDFTNLVKDLGEMNYQSLVFVMSSKTIESINYLKENNLLNQISDNFLNYKNAYFITLPFLKQEDYDKILAVCDCNIVRGEDSFTRAISASKPFIWHAYLQENGYQIVKVEAYLKFVEKFFEDKNIFEIYKEIMYNTNRRIEDSYLIKRDFSYKRFFELFDDMNFSFEKMSKYTIEKSNIVKKLLGFINSLI